MVKGYMRHVQVDEDGEVECPKLERFIAAVKCRKQCRYYYGRSVVQFVDDFNPNLSRKGRPVSEHEVRRDHICNYPTEE